MSGIDFKLEENAEILKINTPKVRVGGPYAVVYKNLKERWAIVALDWEEEPRLGIRWFHDKVGNPISRGYPTWLVIPPSLSKGILSSLPLDHGFGKKVDEYLSGTLSGEKLRNRP